MLSDLYLSSLAERPHLRIGLLIDSPVLPAAFASVLHDLERTNFARIELIVYNAASSSTASGNQSRFATMWRLVRDPKLRAGLGWAIYSKLDERFSRSQHDPLAPVDCSNLLSGIEVLRVEPITKKFVQRFPAEALDAIRARKLDVLLRFGFNILRGDVLQSARYGIWSFHHGDNDYYRGGPAHFWELYEGRPLSGVILQVLTDELDAGTVLVKGLFATQPAMSLARNRIQPYWGSAHFIIQKLWELHSFGWPHVQARISPAAPYLGQRKIYRMPGNRELIRWAVPQILKRAARRVWTTAAHGEALLHWRVAVRTGADRPLCDAVDPGMKGFHWLEAPQNHFYADPFLLRNEDSHWLFFEDYDYQQQRGTIACAELQPNGTIGPAVTALDTAAHASYPYVFSEAGTLFMIPETLQNNSVRLYRCIRFPDQWKLEAELFEGPVLDTSVYKHEGRWWFFTTFFEPRGSAIALYLFSAADLTGKWQYHPANPISLDVRTARGAGAIQSCSAKLIRPSQDCSRRYGYAVNFSEIQILNPLEYRETLTHTIEPTWDRNLLGMHTYNRSGPFEVIDGVAYRRRSKVQESRADRM